VLVTAALALPAAFTVGGVNRLRKTVITIVTTALAFRLLIAMLTIPSPLIGV
jgi:hypothetical protein